MSFDEIFDLTAGGVYFYFYDMSLPLLHCFCCVPLLNRSILSHAYTR